MSAPTVTIVLSNGAVSLVDADDAHRVVGWTWRQSKGYAVRGTKAAGKFRTLRLHREIMSAELATAPAGTEVDHINGNKLDNRRANLRLATHAENARNRGAPRSNTSGFKGVSWNRRDNRWQAHIRTDGKLRSLGYFNSAGEAHAAYCEAADALHGAFANTEGPPAPVLLAQPASTKVAV